MQSLQLRTIIALSLLGALGLAVLIAQTLTRRAAPTQVELVAVEVGTLQPLLRSDRPVTIAACLVEGVQVGEGGRIRRLLARPGQEVRRGALLADLDDGGTGAMLAKAQQEAATMGAAAHEVCRKPPHGGSRRDRLGELRRDSVAQNAETRIARHPDLDGSACARARRAAAAAFSIASRLRAEAERYTLRAPVDGVLLAMRLAPGDVIAADQTAPITIARSDCRAVRTQALVPARNIRAVGPGATACIQPERESGQRRCDAIVRSVAPGDGDGPVPEVLVEFKPDARDRDAAIGEAAMIEIPLASRQRVTRIPVTAVLEGDRVLMFDASSRRLRWHRVETGVADDNYVEVLAGLKVGDRIARTPRALTIDEDTEVAPATVSR
jgi:HlyD family secretion protein